MVTDRVRVSVNVSVFFNRKTKLGVKTGDV